MPLNTRSISDLTSHNASLDPPETLLNIPMKAHENNNVTSIHLNLQNEISWCYRTSTRKKSFELLLDSIQKQSKQCDINFEVYEDDTDKDPRKTEDEINSDNQVNEKELDQASKVVVSLETETQLSIEPKDVNLEVKSNPSFKEWTQMTLQEEEKKQHMIARRWQAYCIW